jgi:molybdopterin converting factor small subunit
VPEVRLFAQARDAAGTSSVTVEGSTVAQVLDALVEEVGPVMAEVVGICKVWVNGEPSDPEASVGPQDEVALLPPVSGGCR